MNPEEKIKITYYTPLQGPNVLANFGCHCIADDLYFSKLSLIKNKDGGIFIGWPGESYIDPKTGQKARSNHCWYGKEKAPIFQKECLDALKAYCQRKGIPYSSIPVAAPAPSMAYSNPDHFIPQEECPF